MSLGASKSELLKHEFDNFFINEEIYKIPYSGGIFKYSIVPKVPSENQLELSDNLFTLPSSSSQQGFLQVFKPSQENINELNFVLEGKIQSDNIIEDFSSYSSSTDLQNNYIEDGFNINSNFQMNLDDNDGTPGAPCLRLDVRSFYGNYCSVKKEFISIKDISTYTNLKFFTKTNLKKSSNIYKFFIEDTYNNKASFTFTPSSKDWSVIDVDFSSFNNISVIDIERIKFIGISGHSIEKNEHIYIDTISFCGGSLENPINVELFDFGTSPSFSQLPSSPISLSDGSSYSELLLTSKRNFYSCPLDINNLDTNKYYGILLKTPLDGILCIYGSNSQLYQSGKCYTVESDGSLIENQGSICFNVLGSINSKLSSIIIELNGELIDGCKIYLFVKDISTNSILDYFEYTFDKKSNRYILDLDYVYPESIYYTDNTKLELFYSDSSSKCESIKIISKFHFSSISQNG